MSITVLQNNFPSNLSVQSKVYKPGIDNNYNSSNGVASFGKILADKANDAGNTDNINNIVKFSKHASSRLEQRNIELSDSQLERLNEGARKASGKGINESLIMVDQLAFIVNIPNSTVITAMDQTETDENIFTNIDGAVII